VPSPAGEPVTSTGAELVAGAVRRRRDRRRAAY